MNVEKRKHFSSMRSYFISAFAHAYFYVYLTCSTSFHCISTFFPSSLRSYFTSAFANAYFYVYLTCSTSFHCISTFFCVHISYLRLHTLIRIIFKSTCRVSRHFTAFIRFSPLLCVHISYLRLDTLIVIIFVPRHFYVHIYVCTRLFESFLRLPALFHVISPHFYVCSVLCVLTSYLRLHTLIRIIFTSTYRVPRHFTAFLYTFFCSTLRSYSNHFYVYLLCFTSFH